MRRLQTPSFCEIHRVAFCTALDTAVSKIFQPGPKTGFSTPFCLKICFAMLVNTYPVNTVLLEMYGLHCGRWIYRIPPPPPLTNGPLTFCFRIWTANISYLRREQFVTSKWTVSLRCLYCIASFVQDFYPNKWLQLYSCKSSSWNELQQIKRCISVSHRMVYRLVKFCLILMERARATPDWKVSKNEVRTWYTDAMIRGNAASKLLNMFTI